MDRHTLTLAGCGLMLLLASTGCKSTRSEVPPGRPYMSDGRQMPPGSTLFSSDPHPMAGNALSNTPGNPPGAPGALPGMPGSTPGTPGGQPGAPGQFGTPGPGASTNWGAPTGHAYGPPGTSGVVPTQASSPVALPTSPSAGAGTNPTLSPSPTSSSGPMGTLGAPSNNPL